MMWNLVAGALGTAASLLAAQRLPILIFHRVLSQRDPLFPEEVDAERFDALMAVVARHFKVMTLGQAARARRHGVLPGNALVITFDDGYADNAEVALPILQKHGLCATFFVATHFLDGGRMWNDTVIESIRNCNRPELDLQPFGLRSMELHSPASRRDAINALLPKLKYASLAQREDGLQLLAGIAGHPPLNDHLMMRSSQVLDLHRAGMEIGGHTVHHPILTELDEASAREEIVGGRQRLESITGAPVTVFAYPNGGPRKDYDARHVAIVREAGFEAAVSTATGVSEPGSDPHQLPRFTPWDRHLGRWLARVQWQRLSGQRFATA
jgi:peptidoglycan/xylan/chitin deacetylase (PgdA/CDA1 family)